MNSFPCVCPAVRQVDILMIFVGHVGRMVERSACKAESMSSISTEVVSKLNIV